MMLIYSSITIFVYQLIVQGVHHNMNNAVIYYQTHKSFNKLNHSHLPKHILHRSSTLYKCMVADICRPQQLVQIVLKCLWRA